MKLRLTATYLVILLSFVSASAQAQLAHAQNSAEVSPWPAKILTDISREVDHSGTQLINVLFDQIDEFDPSMWSRLAQFWNPLITLWRIPWTKEGIKKFMPVILIPSLQVAMYQSD